MNIKEILELHKKYLECIEGGEKADLCGADLRGVNLRGIDLYGVDLCGADLCGADLRGANLRRADLCGADLRGANLYRANLCETNLRVADLREANLREANLDGANLYGADLRGAGLYVLQLSNWTAYIHRETIKIGCKHYTFNEWENFTDEEINKMDTQALEWWKQYKSLIMCAAKKMQEEL